ncbi:MAG: 2-oxoacid:acceptor oxidoreductase family protein [Sedimentisphaerales bacterium]|nr:2-oxoacid:acceptor oxidoreductase family protein [Sedimentisphaerales bacterium]
MSKYFEVRWHGRGGQGTVTGAKSLAEAVQGTGKCVSAFPDYGPERRGAPVRAFDRFSDSRIRIHTPVLSPDVVMIVDTTLIGGKGLVEGAGESTIFVVNTERNAAETKELLSLTTQPVYTVPANSISYRLFKREIPNSAMMGAFARACPEVISLEALVAEAEKIFAHILAADLVGKNIEAIKCGYDEVQTA